MLRNLNAVGRGRVRPHLGFAALLLTILFVGGSAQAAPANYFVTTFNFGGPGDVPPTFGLPFTAQTPVGAGSLTTGFTVMPLGLQEVPIKGGGIVNAAVEYWQFNMVNTALPLVFEIDDPDLYSYIQVGEASMAPLTWDGGAPVYGTNYGSTDPTDPWYPLGFQVGAIAWFTSAGVPEPVVDILSLGIPIGPHPLGLGFNVMYAATLGGLMDIMQIASNALDPTDPTISLQQMMYVTTANIITVDGFHVAVLATPEETPEPSAGLLLGGALAGLALLLRRARA